ncbi:hypothetical protein P5V15_008475 [Pogonomyrmex californicus]
MESSRDYYYDICKKYLILIGQWPYQKPREKFIFLSSMILLLATVIVTQIARFVVCDSAQCIYETLPPHMLAIMILVKIFTYQFNSRKIKDLTDRLFVDWDMLESKEEHEIMRRYAENGRWYALIFAKLFEDIFSIAFAVQLFIVTVGLSITLVQLSIQLHDLTEAMRYFVFIIAQLFHLFCLNFQGQKVIDYSLETCDKIYHGLWYTIPVKELRLLLFVMKRSLEASVVTAGKMYVFSLENFTMIVQSSMSYFTLLSSFEVS